jgi:general secretion pathway protein K
MSRTRQPKGERGFALVSVLWAMVILAAIAASIIATGRTEARLSHTHLDIAQLDAAADAAINLTILRMLDAKPENHPRVDGTPARIDFAGHRILVTVQDEGGKVDLNMADGELLRQLLLGAGVAVEAAQPLVDKILDWREGGDLKRLNGAKAREYAAAGTLYGPRTAPFQSVEELQLVLGMTPALYARLAPSLTVYSQTPWVNDAFASLDVLNALARMDGTPASAVLVGRKEGKVGSVMIGHAFTITAAVGGADGLSVTRRAVIRLSGAPGAPVGLYQWR